MRTAVKLLVAATLLVVAIPAEAQIAAGKYARFRLQTAHVVPPAGFIHLWCKESDSTCYQTDENGTDTALGGGGGGDMVLADVQTVTGAKTFNSGTLKLNNAGNTFASTLATAATAARTWTLPDASDTAVGLAATQELTNKTVTGAVLKNGVTASGSTAYDLSGSTGTWKPPTGGLAANLVLSGATFSWSIGDNSHILDTVYASTIQGNAAVNFTFINAGTAIPGSLYLRPQAAAATGWRIQENKLSPDTDAAETVGSDGKGLAGVYFSAAAAPASPSSGEWVIYVDTGDGNKLKAKASTGTVVTLGTP